MAIAHANRVVNYVGAVLKPQFTLVPEPEDLGILLHQLIALLGMSFIS